MAILPLELAINGVANTLDKVDQFTPQLPGPAGKASSTDDGFLDIDDVPPPGGRGVKSALSQSIRSNDLKPSYTKDITPGYSGQATSCELTEQSEEPCEDIQHGRELGRIIHDISIPERFTERAILEPSTGRPNDDVDISYKVKLVNTALQSQQKPALVQGGQLEYSRPSAHGPAATEEKEQIPDHWTRDVGDEDKLKERISDKRATSLSTSPEPIKRRQWHPRTCSGIQSEAEDVSDAHHKISPKRTCIGKKRIDVVQSATVADGDWLIDGIVGERQGAEGREFW
ncbi:MAG: hypothetical protein M1820_009738 [Bogoriella megaspora]|nr:MAG: hypothetical protein M1820_009738 [Bogoriella megaspora]